MAEKEKYLIVKGCAGVGNRLLTVFAANQYCEKTGRQLVIDWADGQFDVKGSNAFFRCFSMKRALKVKSGEIRNWHTMSHTSALFKDLPDAGVYDLYYDHTSSVFRKLPPALLFTEGLRKLKRSWKARDGHSTSLCYGSDLSVHHHEDVVYYIDFTPHTGYSEMPDHIGLTPSLEAKIGDFAKTNELADAVGVHVRNTDKRPSAKLNSLLDCLKQQHLTSRIFLATDSAETEALFRREISNLVLYPKTIPPLASEGLHQWALYNKRDDMKLQLFEESVIEMFLLSRCRQLYFQGNSTYSNISRVYHPDPNHCYDWLRL